MNYFITGATGFLGQHLVPRLRAMEPDAQIRYLTRSTTVLAALAQAGAELVRGDLADVEALRRGVSSSHCVIHLAGATHTRDEAVYRAVNVEGTARLARLSADQNVQRFVFVSSRAIGKACGAYGRSKQQAEDAVRAIDGLRYTILRFAEVYGPHTTEGMGRLFQLVRQSAVVPVLRGAQLAPVYIADAVDALLQCLTNPAAEGAVYTIAGPRSYSVDECARLMASALGVRRMLVPVPVTLARLIGRCVGACRMGAVVPDQVDRLWCRKDDDISRARRDLQFAPRLLEEGLQCLL